MDDDDWAGKRAVLDVADALSGWRDVPTILEIVALALRKHRVDRGGELLDRAAGALDALRKEVA